MSATDISAVEDKFGPLSVNVGIECKSCKTKENRHQEISFKYIIEFQETTVPDLVNVSSRKKKILLIIIHPDKQRIG